MYSPEMADTQIGVFDFLCLTIQLCDLDKTLIIYTPGLICQEGRILINSINTLVKLNGHAISFRIEAVGLSEKLPNLN